MALALTEETVPQQHFKFSIGPSAWIGMMLFYLLWYRSLGDSGADFTTTERLMLPLIPVGMLAGSIVIHEFAHAAAMLANSIRVGRISLEIWGGYTQAADDGPSPFQLSAGKVFTISVAGPLSNLLVAAGLWFFALDAPSLSEISGPYASRMELWLSLALRLNLLLAIFNMLPLMPLDGGHVFRSLLMGISGGVVVGTASAGLFSVIVGTAYIRYIVAEAMQGGWEAIQSHAFLAVFSGIAVIVSILIMMGTIAERQDSELKGVHPFQRVAAIMVAGLPVATLYMLHVQDGWRHLPTWSEIAAFVLR